MRVNTIQQLSFLSFQSQRVARLCDFRRLGQRAIQSWERLINAFGCAEISV
jgi:hypothetical protein